MKEILVENSGIIMMILRLMYVVIGFSTQILKNHREKRFGRSTRLFFLALLTYIFGTIYGLSILDKYILAPYALGLVFLFILLYQYLLYQKN